MSEIQRYAVMTSRVYAGADIMWPESNGEYVKYEDHRKAITALEAENKELRGRVRGLIINTLTANTKEMEGYCYYNSNPGVSQDDYEDIADEVVAGLTKPKQEATDE